MESTVGNRKKGLHPKLRFGNNNGEGQVRGKDRKELEASNSGTGERQLKEENGKATCRRKE